MTQAPMPPHKAKAPLKVAIQQPEHAPWLGFFHKMVHVDLYIFLDNVQFKKRYFENRNKIRTADGWTWVTAPVKVKGRYTQLICEVELAHDDGWKRSYEGRLRNSYIHAPCSQDLLAWLCGVWLPGAAGRLQDMNLACIEHLRGLLAIETPTALASELLPEGLRGSDLILELCRVVGADIYLSGPDGSNYLDAEGFAGAGIKLEFHHFEHPTYPQIHPRGFLSHMSTLDALFNIGPTATRRMLLEAL